MTDFNYTDLNLDDWARKIPSKYSIELHLIGSGNFWAEIVDGNNALHARAAGKSPIEALDNLIAVYNSATKEGDA